MRVNLLVEEKQGVIFDYLRVIITLAVLLTLFIIAFLQFNLITNRNVLESEIRGIENQLAIYLPQEEEYKRFEAAIEEIQNTPSIPNYIWDGPIEAMGYLTPLRGVIDNFSLKNRSLNIRGRTKAAEELRELTINLSESEYFTNVDLQTMEKQEEVRFTITAELIERESE
ncbi:PilN domain-containing protein [Halanaerobium congolense]|jgi:type IV pilus assembly protein PilN|uniref:Type IV pilus assembly protein PilN n=1 Tax=Halanaerobium congolense TaxID=54121 RepID=A0A4R7E9I8_9FIRM|nr:PilN domain-containing protein [Halanaerobium congolense]TDS31735.1 type IV pilus assembly protein PilN [Halanaerobium congolense]